MKQRYDNLSERISLPFKLFMVTVLSIFISSLFVNQIEFSNSHTVKINRLTEAFLITILLLPELYLLFYRPLNSYVHGRKRAEEELRNLNRDLEALVIERTKELTELNKLLEEEYTESLRYSEEKYRNVIESVGVGITIISTKMEILSVNNHVKKWFPDVDFTQRPICYKTFIDPPRENACDGCPVKLTFEDGQAHESTLHLPRGKEVRINKTISTPLKDKNGNVIGAVEVSEDITQRKMYEDALKGINANLKQKIKEQKLDLEIAQEALINSEERYRALIRQSSEGVIILDPISLIIMEANTQICNMLGYVEHELIGQSLEKIAGRDFGSIKSNIRRILFKGESVFSLRQYQHKNGSMVEIEVYASLIKYGKSRFILANIRDITERRQAEKALKESFSNLKKTLEETVNALITIAEKRDPYTAGHQNRVAKLACAIAMEMGLSQKQIEGILIAAKLHDIGKIFVPADILNKPGRLTNMEMGIIKSHPYIGYEILEKIPFESPVAQIVAQHHERLDGSGYPYGLCSEEILLEAKILCVADVVEAMASHRPYRPALESHKAIKEIINNKGILYEPEVVDACLKVIDTKSVDFMKHHYEITS